MTTKRIQNIGIPFLLTLFLFNTGFSQNKTFFKMLPSTFESNDLINTSDGGYAITGHIYTLNDNLEDLAVIKTNSQGEILWQTTSGKKGNDLGSSIIQTTDGGYVAVGTLDNSTDSTGSSTILVIKIDDKGTILWTKIWEEKGNSSGESIVETFDHNYLISGTNRSEDGHTDILLIKINSLGQEIYSKNIKTVNCSEFNGLIKQIDSDYFYFLNQSSNGMFFTKFNTSLSSVWSKQISTNWTDIPRLIHLRDDSTILIIGSTGEISGGEDGSLFVVSIDKKGEILNRNNIGINGKSKIVMCAESLASNRYVIGGYERTWGGYSNSFVSILDGSEITWSKQIVVDKSIPNGSITSIKPTSDKGYILTGYISDSGSHQGYILKMDSKGNF